MFFASLLSNRFFLFITTLLVMLLMGLFMVEEWHLFMQEMDAAAVKELKEQEESIALLLVGFGVLLEGRHILQQWVAGGAEIESSEATHRCEYYGFVLLAIGLFIEIVDQCLSFVASIEVTKWVEILVNYPLNIYAMYLLICVAVVLVNPKYDQQAAH